MGLEPRKKNTKARNEAWSFLKAQEVGKATVVDHYQPTVRDESSRDLW